jgi:5-methylcytosine-specific restriction endonuclease McrA
MAKRKKWKFIRLGKYERNQKKFDKRLIKEEFEYWKRETYERDGHKCAICQTTESLTVHHIVVRENHDLRFDPMNAIVLCIAHHKYSRILSAHNNSFVFFIWLEKNRPEQYAYLKHFLEQNSISKEGNSNTYTTQ